MSDNSIKLKWNCICFSDRLELFLRWNYLIYPWNLAEHRLSSCLTCDPLKMAVSFRDKKLRPFEISPEIRNFIFLQLKIHFVWIHSFQDCIKLGRKNQLRECFREKNSTKTLWKKKLLWQFFFIFTHPVKTRINITYSNEYKTYLRVSIYRIRMWIWLVSSRYAVSLNISHHAIARWYNRWGQRLLQLFFLFSIFCSTILEPNLNKPIRNKWINNWRNC